MFWSIVLVLLSVYFSIKLLIRRQYSYWKDRGIPHDEVKFPYGTIKNGKDDPHSSELNLSYLRKYKGQTPFVGIYLSVKPGALVIDLDLAKKILITDFDSFSDRGTFYNEKADPLSAHIFNMEKARWKSVRNKLSPTFTSGKLKTLFPMIESITYELTKALRQEMKIDSDIEMKEILARYGTTVVANCFFGLDSNSLTEPNNKFREMGIKALTAPKNSRMKNLTLMVFKDLGRLLNQKRVREDVSEFFMNVVKDTIEYREKNNVQRVDFMDLMMKQKNNANPAERLTLNEIAAQAFLFFFAGFETSATAVLFTLLELAQNPDIQEKARNEVLSVLQKHDGKSSYEALTEMKYLDLCLSESMRKWPPATNTIREAKKTFEYQGKTIEKGVSVWIPIYAYHHDPNVWPEPDKFIPERFLPEEVAKRHPMAYIPFGEGPRICIGNRFAQMQTRITLVTLLRSFRFELSPKTPMPFVFRKGSPVLTPTGGIYLRLTEL